MASQITELPEELLVSILSFVTNHHELCELRKVSRTFKRVASDETLWRDAFYRETDLDFNSSTFWKDLFVYFHGLTHKVRKLLIEREQLRMDVQDLQTLQEHYRNEANDLISQIHSFKEREEQSMHQKLRIADEVRVGKEIIEELTQTLRSRDDQLSEIYDLKKDLERQLNSEKEHCLSLKKEVTEYRELWEKELEEVSRLKRDAKHKEKQMEKLEETEREKSKEVSKLQEKLERIAREERLKRAVLERRLETLGTQLSEENRSFQEYSDKISKEKESLKKEVESEFEQTLRLKKRNRELERELRRKTEFFELEISRMKSLVSKTSKISGALSITMAKA